MTPRGLAEVPSLIGINGTARANLGGVIREGRSCDLGNFSNTRLSGKRLFGPTLAKARSGLVPVFRGRNKNWQRPWRCIGGQDN